MQKVPGWMGFDFSYWLGILHFRFWSRRRKLSDRSRSENGNVNVRVWEWKDWLGCFSYIAIY